MKATKYNQFETCHEIEEVWKIDLMSDSDHNEYYYPPNNFAEIIVVLNGSIQRNIVGKSSFETLDKYEIYLTNVRSKGTTFIPDGDASFLIVKLNPCTQHYFQKGGMFYSRDKLTRISIPILDAMEWKKHIYDQEIKEILIYLEYFILNKKPRESDHQDSTVSKSIDIIRKHNGQVKVKDLYNQMGICKSTLEHKFNKEVGISPKEFCKIEKLNYFLSNYKTYEDNVTLTELTYKSGYYDQSHLIKDFQQFIEQNPKRFFNGKGNILL